MAPYRGVKTRLAPGFLVASPGLRCPFFHHTLVLLVEHDDGGSLGFVLNRPSGTPLSELIRHLDADSPEALGGELDGELGGEIWVGGPVAPETGWVIFDPDSGDTRAIEQVKLGDRIAVTASRALLESLARGAGPERYAVLLGYAGWGPGQLDEEIREGSWMWAELDPALVFERPPEERWQAALEAMGIDPAHVSGQRVADA